MREMIRIEIRDRTDACAPARWRRWHWMRPAHPARLRSGRRPAAALTR